MANLLDLGNKIINKAKNDFLQSGMKFPESKEVEQTLKNADLKLIEGINERFSVILNDDYDLKDFENNREVHSIISDKLTPIFHQAKINTTKILDYIFSEKTFLTNITDKKFKAYYELRVNLKKLKTKIKKSENESCYCYSQPNIELILSRIDEYLMNYILTMLILSNAENIVLMSRHKSKPVDITDCGCQIHPPHCNQEHYTTIK